MLRSRIKEFLQAVIGQCLPKRPIIAVAIKNQCTMDKVPIMWVMRPLKFARSANLRKMFGLEIGNRRQEIARVYTVLRERELGLASGPDGSDEKES